MYGKDQKILYVGKAKKLKRLSSYFRANGLSIKTKALVAKIVDIGDSYESYTVLEQELVVDETFIIY